MITIEGLKADEIRAKYIDAFINKKSEHYIYGILKNTTDKKNLYNGYLWECFKNCNLISEKDSFKIIRQKKTIYVFWDIALNHLGDIKYKFPKYSIIELSAKEFLVELKNFPEDIYVCDESLSWTIALTHETNSNNLRYCLLCVPPTK